MCLRLLLQKAAANDTKSATTWVMLTKKIHGTVIKNQIEAQQSGFDLEGSRDRMSERRLLQKSRRERYAVRGDVVEPAGIEPASESASEGTSPGAAYLQNSRPRLRIRRQPGLVAS